MEETVLISIMALLIVLAAFTSILLSKLKLPSLVGFLITGIIIANYIDLPEGTQDVVDIFSNLGLIMLMFAIGMEIDITKLKVQGKFAIGIAIIQIPVMLFAGIIAGSAMGFNSVQAITLGAILSGASTAVVLAVLKSNNVLDQAKMDILVLVMVIEDISQVIMISILTPMMKGGTMSTDSLIVLIIYIVLFMVLCFTLGLKIVPRIIDWFYARSNNELIALLCVGLLFVLALLANFAGLSVAIGAFLCGVMVGMSKPKEVVEHFIDPLKVLFMAMFFISVGMEVSVDSLVSNIPMIAVIYLIFIGCMFIAVNIGYWVANGDSRSGWISAFAMCTMGEFAFIISKEALDYKVIDMSLYSSIVGAAIVSMMILPLLVRSSDKSYNALGKVVPKPVKDIGHWFTVQRDMLYHGLGRASYNTKKRFTKGLTNVFFLIILIIVLEVGFFYLYTPLSDWLTKNFGADEYTWRIVILFANIIVLLEPFRRVAKFMKFSVYMIQKGKLNQDMVYIKGADPKPTYEYFSTLAVGAAMTVFVVLVVPNGIDNLMHVFVLLVVLAGTVLYQAYKYKKMVSQNSSESETDAETATEDAQTEEGNEGSA